jgi:uncharacterized protein YbjT (DUF2867 family)
VALELLGQPFALVHRHILRLRSVIANDDETKGLVTMTGTRIAVAGATGRVGRHIVEVAQERGHDVVPMARSLGVDVISGEGLDQALTGVDVIIDAATGPSAEQDEATTFFTSAARNLQAAGERSGVRRMVVVSIIGADRFSEGYGAATYAHEQTAAAGPIPTRVVRAAQFHEFVPQLMEWGTQGDSAYVQDMWTQAVAARTVAEALVDAATDESPDSPALVEVAGPREESMVALAQRYATRHQPGLKIVAVPTPEGPDQKIYDEGGLLPGPDARLGGPTFEEWLDSTA